MNIYVQDNDNNHILNEDDNINTLIKKILQ